MEKAELTKETEPRAVLKELKENVKIFEQKFHYMMYIFQEHLAVNVAESFLKIFFGRFLLILFK